MTPGLSVLRAVREYLSDPWRWSSYGPGDHGQLCVGVAINQVQVCGVVDSGEREAAGRAVQLHLGITSIPYWNDSPSTTHRNVLAALDGTIAMLELQGQVRGQVLEMEAAVESAEGVEPEVREEVLV